MFILEVFFCNLKHNHVKLYMKVKVHYIFFGFFCQLSVVVMGPLTLVSSKGDSFHLIISIEYHACIEICSHMFCSNYFVIIDLTLDIKMFLTYWFWAILCQGPPEIVNWNFSSRLKQFFHKIYCRNLKFFFFE